MASRFQMGDEVVMVSSRSPNPTLGRIASSPAIIHGRYGTRNPNLYEFENYPYSNSNTMVTRLTLGSELIPIASYGDKVENLRRRQMNEHIRLYQNNNNSDNNSNSENSNGNNNGSENENENGSIRSGNNNGRENNNNNNNDNNWNNLPVAHLPARRNGGKRKGGKTRKSRKGGKRNNKWRKSHRKGGR